MKRIKTGDIVVSMVAQSTNNHSCPIPMGYVSKAIVSDDYHEQVVWFEETTSGEGNYPAENFRLATAEEARLKWPCTLLLDRFDFLPGDRVEHISRETGTVVGISTNNPSEPSYLVKLDNSFKYDHNGNDVSLFIGSTKQLNGDGWYYDATDLRKLNVSTSLTGTFINTIGTTPITGSSTSTSTGILVHPDPWGIPDSIAGSSTAYIPKDYVDFSKLSGHVPSYSTSDYDVAMAIAIKELQKQPMSYKDVKVVFSDKKDVNHQEAIILKSKSNKRKLITV